MRREKKKEKKKKQIQIKFQDHTVLEQKCTDCNRLVFSDHKKKRTLKTLGEDLSPEEGSQDCWIKSKKKPADAIGFI